MFNGNDNHFSSRQYLLKYTPKVRGCRIDQYRIAKELFLTDLTIIYSQSESTYYKYSNPDIGSTQKELIKVFKHKVYTFNINLYVISSCQSHFIIQFIKYYIGKYPNVYKITLYGGKSKRGLQCQAKIREIPRIGENTEMFTNVPVRRGVGSCEIESKGLS